MASEHQLEQKGKVKPKPSQEASGPKKDEAPLSASQMQGNLDANTLTRLQQTVGNAAVQRFLAQRQSSGPAEIDDDTADAIRSKQGSGQALDKGVAEKAGGALGHDFSGVNVHIDGQADQLNRSLGAKAFTTGNDIFFRSGAYDPGSSEGQRLISHELTHVVQQGASPPAVQGKMKVNDPNDQYEAEADKVADTVMNYREDGPVQRQEVPEEEEMAQTKGADLALRQEVPEEEEMAQTKGADLALRQEVPEEEEMAQTKGDDLAQRQEVPEEEELAQAQEEAGPALQMQEEI